MNNERHPCRYIDCTLEHDGSWVDGKWYEWEDIYGNREVARMKLDAIGYDLESILQMNVDKLRTRYPDGFSTEQSLHRSANDI